MESKPTIVAIAVVEHDGSFLVGERPAGKPLAGFAEFPGGRVDDGETPEDAAIRECYEETGVRIHVVGTYGERLHEYDYGAVHLHFFACAVEVDSVRPRPPFCWVARADLAMLKFPAANRDLLLRLLAE
jgi:8-oxo-dGTP diphosphatase